MNEYQTTIFGQEEAVVVPLQRHSPTSIAAAQAIAKEVKGLRRVVLACIVEHGPLTDEAIATLTNLNPSTARPRRIELVRDGFVRAGGVQKTVSGRDATLWTAT